MAKGQSTDFKNKQRTGTKAILLWLVAVVLFLLILSSVVGLFIKYRAIRSHINDLKEGKAQLEEKKATLTNTNEYMNTTEGQEQVFRDKYRLVKPGEGVIVITKEEPKTTTLEKNASLQRFWDSIMRGLGLR